MNYRDNATNTFMHIQPYSYKSDLGLYDAITQMVERSALDDRLYDCLVHETLAEPHFLKLLLLLFWSLYITYYIILIRYY